ncbi:uncharacterized protein [Antedon mediterranea]|uniref:uncharacterized protein n=1 Tax=Antedon mediterranea TaxID=105859 RepID=UPI003AF9A1C3
MPVLDKSRKIGLSEGQHIPSSSAAVKPAGGQWQRLGLLGLDLDITTKNTSSLPAKRLSNILWNKNIDKANEALHTDFIQGIQSGLLDPTSYGKYTLQDAVYCYQAAETVEVAQIKAEDENDILMVNFLTARKDMMKEYASSILEDWHLNDPTAIKLGEAVRTYITLGRNVAETKHPFYLLVAMLPCSMLWSWLATEIQSGISDTNVYSSWIKKNLIGNRTGGSLVGFIDVYAEKYQLDLNELEIIYRGAMDSEVRFFSSATRV